MLRDMDQEERAEYQKQMGWAVARAKREGTTLSHVMWRDGHLECGFTRPVPKEGLELIAAKAELPPTFEPRPKKTKRGIVQAELPL